MYYGSKHVKVTQGFEKKKNFIIDLWQHYEYALGSEYARVLNRLEFIILGLNI